MQIAGLKLLSECPQGNTFRGFGAYIAMILILSCPHVADGATPQSRTGGRLPMVAKSVNTGKIDSPARVDEGGARSGELAAQARKLISERRFDAGAEMLIGAMKQKDGVNWNAGMYSPANLRGDLCFEELFNAKRFRILEKIIEESMSLHPYEPYDWNHDCYIEKCLSAELFLRQKKVSEATKWLHASISTLKDDHTICDGGSRAFGMMHSEAIVPLAEICVAQKDYALAESVLKEISSVLAERVGPKHMAWVQINLIESTLAQGKGTLDVAETLARKALEVEIWNYGASQNRHDVRVALAGILKAEGKISEAAEILITPPVPQEEPREFSKLYPDSTFSLHAREPRKYGASAEKPLQALLENAILVHGEGSDQVKTDYDELAKFYFQQNRFDESRSTLDREMTILDEQYGTCLLPKFKCHLRMAEICEAKHDKVGARKYAELLESTPMDKYFPVNRDIRVANVLWYSDKHDRAIEIARGVENDLKNRRGRRGGGHGYSVDPSECIDFMEKADLREDAHSLRVLFGIPEATLHSNDAETNF